MKISKRQFTISIITLIITVVALALMIIDWAMTSNITSHPIFTFFLVLFSGLGIMCFVLGFTNKSPWYFFLSAILLGLSVLYCLIYYAKLPWYIVVISVFVVWVIVCTLSIVRAGNQTEEIALNKSPDYKDYKERKAEKEAAEAQEEVKPLPEIKSFKDEK